MSGTNGANPSPDLATILQTLASLAPAQQEQGISSSSAGLQQTSRPYSYPLPEAGFVQNLAKNSSSTQANHGPYVPALTAASPAGRLPQGRSQGDSASPSPIDPATIIDWKQGLRCVSSIGSQNEYFKAGIRKVMSDQYKHESMWWNSRVALIQSHGDPSEDDTAESLREELATFDRKLFHAQKEMVDSISNDLRRLGVPFFGTKPHLLSDSSTPIKSTSGQINREELLVLQRKMIQHLEDMYQP